MWRFVVLALMEHAQVDHTTGLGHGISQCPKLEDAQRRQNASHRAANEGGGGY
jgi:hypothetical protein